MLPARKLRRVGDKGQGFPLPPKEESANWENLTHKELCDPPDASVIEKILRKVIYTDPQSGDIKNLGNYLSPYFSVIIGHRCVP